MRIVTGCGMCRPQASMAVFSWGREVQTDVVMKMRMHVGVKVVEEAMGDTAADLDRGNNEKPVLGKGYLKYE